MSRSAILLTSLLSLGVVLGCCAARAQGQQSAYFHLSRPRLVQQHIYYRDRLRGPACKGQVVRNAPCLGANGLILWR